MTAKVMTAFDVIINIIFAAFKRAAMTVVLTALAASTITAILFILGYSLMS
jgi:hypothetical protein